MDEAFFIGILLFGLPAPVECPPRGAELSEKSRLRSTFRMGPDRSDPSHRDPVGPPTVPTTPPAPPTHKPIPHVQVVGTLVEALSFRHIGVVNEEYAVTVDEMKVCGVLDLETQAVPGSRFAIRICHSHDKSMRLGLTVGRRVMVCFNMAFHSDFTLGTMLPIDANARALVYVGRRRTTATCVGPISMR
jgi:hypothetical protein